MAGTLAFVSAALLVLATPRPAAGQAGPGVNPQFAGRWCVQGDPTRVATITAGLTGLNLTNETGSTSPGQQMGTDPSTVVALQWNLVQGTIGPTGNRINWTNGTYWVRCSAAASGNTLDGTWYANGKSARQCSISQQFGALSFINELGVSAAGHFDGPGHLTANWQGTTIGGSLSPDGSRITWDNGTFWTRSPLS